ncbi:SMI1/KNR4 family protein [Actinokineospora pegani]|uniref:SMI1/KNR4 family protein n=1 Tax=Actinokineospora pegani TaxID=2654637 RepID=UPI0018D3ACA9|nr:SMI1/KNR4 family protein [Actinokineospora pegani]
MSEPAAAARGRVEAAWQRIDEWLRDFAPATAERWNAPATPEQIAELQRELGVQLPGDLVVSLGVHNGARVGGFTLPPLYAPLSTTEISRKARELCARVAEWDGQFVPFASGGAGSVLYLDQRGAARLAEHSGAGRGGWPPTLPDLLEQTAELLSSGTGPLAARYRPTVDGDGALGWVVR